MSHPTLAAQLYTVRDFTQTAGDFAASLRKIRDIGYSAVQISAIGPIAPQDVWEIVSDLGLRICNTHTAYDRLIGDLDSVIAQHELWQTRHVALGSMPDEFRRSGEDGFKRFAAVANQIGESLHAAGLTFSYHNHSFEFVRFGARTGLDVLFEDTDPRYVQAEIDTFWVQHGGGDPAAWIRKMRGRLPVVHFKDMVILNDDDTLSFEGKQIMAEVGEGNLNWDAILAACDEAGVEWIAVEQDICQRDPFESLQISYSNLKAMGLA